jgi:hemin uptake protein HemP
MTHMPTTFDRPTIARPLPPLSAPVPAPIPVHDAADLTAGGPVAHIRLDSQTYTLRITRQGKLILTK